jgi:hypothetical protein
MPGKNVAIVGVAESDFGDVPQKSLFELHARLRPRHVDSTNVGGSSWEVFIEHALTAIVAGRCNTALLVYGSTSVRARE